MCIRPSHRDSTNQPILSVEERNAETQPCEMATFWDFCNVPRLSITGDTVHIYLPRIPQYTEIQNLPFSVSIAYYNQPMPNLRGVMNLSEGSAIVGSRSYIALSRDHHGVIEMVEFFLTQSWRSLWSLPINLWERTVSSGTLGMRPTALSTHPCSCKSSRLVRCLEPPRKQQ